MRPTNQDIDKAIKKHASTLPSRLREEFTQDMWVNLLGKGDQLQKGNLDLVAFRERENWIQARKYRGRDIPTMDPATFDPPNEVTPERIVSAVETLDMKVSALVAAMQTSVRFSASDITRVIDGIQKGLPWNAIAESVGRSPGAFDYYVAKAREAA